MIQVETVAEKIRNSFPILRPRWTKKKKLPLDAVIIENDAELYEVMHIMNTEDVKRILPEVLLGILDKDDKTGIDDIVSVINVPLFTMTSDAMPFYDNVVRIEGRAMADEMKQEIANNFEDDKRNTARRIEEFDDYDTQQAEAIVLWLSYIKQLSLDIDYVTLDNALAFWKYKANL